MEKVFVSFRPELLLSTLGFDDIQVEERPYTDNDDTRNWGYRLVLPNDYIISVFFGPGSYSDNYDASISDEYDFKTLKRKDVIYRSNNAELAVFTPDGEWYWKDQVEGRQTMEDIRPYHT
jgi:hypothetical protein